MKVKISKGLFTLLENSLQNSTLSTNQFVQNTLSDYLDKAAYSPRGFDGKLSLNVADSPQPEPVQSMEISLPPSAIRTLEELYEGSDSTDGIEAFAGNILSAAIRDLAEAEAETDEDAVENAGVTMPPNLYGRKAYKQNDEKYHRERQRRQQD